MPARRQQAITARDASTNNKKFSNQVQHGEFKIPSRLHMRRGPEQCSIAKACCSHFGHG